MLLNNTFERKHSNEIFKYIVNISFTCLVGISQTLTILPVHFWNEKNICWLHIIRNNAKSHCFIVVVIQCNPSWLHLMYIIIELYIRRSNNIINSPFRSTWLLKIICRMYAQISDPNSVILEFYPHYIWFWAFTSFLIAFFYLIM